MDFISKEEETSELVGKIKSKQVEGREKWLGKTYERRRNQRVSRQNQAEASRRKRKMVGKDLRKR